MDVEAEYSWPDGGEPTSRRPGPWSALVLFVVVNVAAALALVSTDDSLALQRTALAGDVREQCTSFLAERLLVNATYSITLGPLQFDGRNTVTSRYTIRNERPGGSPRIGRLRKGRVRCHVQRRDDSERMRVSAIEAIS